MSPYYRDLVTLVPRDGVFVLANEPNVQNIPYKSPRAEITASQAFLHRYEVVRCLHRYGLCFEGLFQGRNIVRQKCQ